MSFLIAKKNIHLFSEGNCSAVQADKTFEEHRLTQEADFLSSFYLATEHHLADHQSLSFNISLRSKASDGQARVHIQRAEFVHTNLQLVDTNLIISESIFQNSFVHLLSFHTPHQISSLNLNFTSMQPVPAM